MLFIQRKTGRIKIKQEDMSDMIINNLGLNNVINQALITYQTVCPEENLPQSPFLSLACIKTHTGFHNTVRLKLTLKNKSPLQTTRSEEN